MNQSFSSAFVPPNLPLRKPSSSPEANSSTSLPPTMPGEPTHPALCSVGDGSSPVIKNNSSPGLCFPAFTVHACNHCGQQGNFRCKRCKKMPYCSLVCQTEDWKAHRHTCQAFESEPAIEKPKDSALSAAGDRTTNQADMMSRDLSSCKKVYMTDLYPTKFIVGTEIQASVVELYSPGRFFLLPQSPEVLEALQNISTGLQKTCSLSWTPYVPCVGEVCAAQFSCDMNWYRGLIQTLDASQNMANILYIDFGNEERVPVDRIRPLPTNIQPFYPCAMECRIAGVTPVLNDWSSECCITVKQLLAGNIVTVKLLETVENGRVHAVDILLSSGKQLSTFLLKEGYAQKDTVNAAPTKQDIVAMLSASFENFKCLSNGKDDNKWAQPPEPLKQLAGDQFPVVVTHFQSPDDLLVQKVENAGVIQDLQLKLRKHCSQVEASQNFRPAPGTVCCAQFSEDKQWYRATVLAYPSKQHVCVGYIDFGNSEEVDLSQLRPISPSLLTLPMQAMHCGLADVQPIEQSWSKECLKALQRQVSNRILCIKILGVQEGKFLVAMFDESNDPLVNMAKLLITAGYAAPAAVLTSPHLQAEEMTASAQQSVCPPVSEPLVWSTAALPSDGQMVALLASFVDHPGHFYCLLSTEHEKRMELGARLKQHCEANAAPFVPKVGEPCCAVFPGDGTWCRAMVKGFNEGKAALNYVDYGYNITVEKCHLRSITPELLVLPFQAVCCWLTGVEPFGSEWTSEALLWFQSLVGSEQLTARVLSITEQGYGVELESKGQNIAAALICEQLAKAPGEPSKEPAVTMGSTTQRQDCGKESEHNVQKETSEMQTTVVSEVASFPVDWKTVELPLNETFHPYITAVINPSLFYLLMPSQVDQQKLREVMVKVAAYCSNYQDTLSAAAKYQPAPGAACCALFSADNTWYRAVVLEAGEEMSVIYADYGNIEKVPCSQILPIPTHLLELPFQIARCTLTGKEHFPADWPEEVQQVFQSELVGGVLASVQSFDGSSNVLSLTRPIERGGEQLTAMVLDALHVHHSSLKSDETGSSTSPSPAAAPVCSQSESQKELEEVVDTSGPTKTPEPAAQSISAASVSEEPVKENVDQMETQGQNNSNVIDPQTSSCCCLSLKKQMDNLELLIKQLLDKR